MKRPATPSTTPSQPPGRRHHGSSRLLAYLLVLSAKSRGSDLLSARAATGVAAPTRLMSSVNEWCDVVCNARSRAHLHINHERTDGRVAACCSVTSSDHPSSTKEARHHGSGVPAAFLTRGIAHARNNTPPPVVLGLQVGCCPDPDDHGQTTVRYQIYGNVLKGVRDEQGRRVPDGKPRDLPWTVIMPVVRAIRVLEQLVDGDDLFPANTPWSNASVSPGKMRAGHLLTAGAAGHRVQSFIYYANQLADQHGLAFEQIPKDPDGHVTLKRFRRTIAWHIALRRVLDVETARAMADYLDDLGERIDQGEGVSGPAAQRMIKAAREARIRFEGTFLTPKMTEALLDEPRFNIYDNPEAFLTCNNDPAKALCHIGRIDRAHRVRPPAVDRCDPACSNIARTDTHITRLHAEITQLGQEIASPLTPTPLRERLRQRLTLLQNIADHHQRTRIVLTPHTPQTQDGK